MKHMKNTCPNLVDLNMFFFFLMTFPSPDMCQGVYFHNILWNNKGGASQINIMLLWKYGLHMVSVQWALIRHRSGGFMVNPGEEFCSLSDAAGRRGIVKKAISWQTMTVKVYTQDSFVLLWWKERLWLQNDSTTKKAIPSALKSNNPHRRDGWRAELCINKLWLWRAFWTPEYISCFP